MAAAKCLHSTVLRRVYTGSLRDLDTFPLVTAAWRSLCVVMVVVVMPVPLAALLPRGELNMAY